MLRLLDKENLRLDMTKLGFEAESLVKFEKAILKPYGMVLVTGPTGSGKTNTLYSSISRLNQPDTNIMTAEDPVEFQLQGVNQVQMKEQIGLNFAAALRSFLRQDPNIILVGEIRDFETAEIAIKAALTGHLVLSTLHTNGAPETITRLMNMGIEPFLVATSVHLICAQRLVRRICKECTEASRCPPRRCSKRATRRKKPRPSRFTRARVAASATTPGTRAARLVRSHGGRRRDSGTDAGGRLGGGTEEEGDRARHDHVAPQRPDQGSAGMTTLEEVARETIH